MYRISYSALSQTFHNILEKKQILAMQYQTKSLLLYTNEQDILPGVPVGLQSTKACQRPMNFFARPTLGSNLWPFSESGSYACIQIPSTFFVLSISLFLREPFTIKVGLLRVLLLPCLARQEKIRKLKKGDGREKQEEQEN